ncbi:MAG TPA: cytochrome ubiquinol oxidase subunit I [Solirubrobacteraceae bacterium]|nr:cytochrome ubiquinol oxidase subunit I [Solirubrobacteraceae bacterium]
MSTLELARTQFAVTTLFHFIFVPMSIGLALWVAICQTLHYRTGNEVYARMTRFWGRFMLISIAIGVVTGIVQEFQFGMNWSEYSRYVGDVFGAPLAMEGLAAFFLESTFIGLWIFGAGRMRPAVHLATIWLTALGTVFSAYFILAANAWMQHPVGYVVNHLTHRAELTSIFAVLGNSTVWMAFPHTVFGAFLTGGMLVLAISAWFLLRGRDVDVFARSASLMLPLVLVFSIATIGFGDGQARLLESQQPMKMAAAEAVYKTTKGAGLSLFAIAPFEAHPSHLSTNIAIPHLESLIATLSWNGTVKGIDQAQREEEKRFGPGQYMPIVGVVYWTFRLMVGSGFLMLFIAIAGCLLIWKRRLQRARLFHRVAIAAVLLPIIANWSGWIFTEMGRQPWVVYGLLRTSQARSPTVTSTELVISLSAYILVYSILTGIGGRLFLREMRHGPGAPGPAGAGAGRPGGAPAGGAALGEDLGLAY